MTKKEDFEVIEEPKISIYFRCPEASKPEYTINIVLDGKRREYVVPITFEALRLATKLHVEALMRYPVRPVLSSDKDNA